MSNPTNRGGRRNPPGGRPPLATQGKRPKRKINITIDADLLEWVDSHQGNRSAVIERLLQERKGQEDV